MGTAIKHPVPGCFIAVPIWQHWMTKG